jgi:hypothetical protein
MAEICQCRNFESDKLEFKCQVKKTKYQFAGFTGSYHWFNCILYLCRPYIKPLLFCICFCLFAITINQNN